MTKQEEIREGILKIQKCEDDEGCPDEYEGFDPCPECRTNKTIKFLHSQGVVIKVDKKLPDTYLGWRKLEKKTKKMPDYGGGMFEDNVASVQDSHTKKVIRKAGYIATESLIKENHE